MIDYTFTRQESRFLPLLLIIALLLAACGGVSQQDAEATGVALGLTAAAGEAATTEALRSSVEATVRAEAAATAEAANNAAVTPEADASAEPEATPVPPDDPTPVPTLPVFIIQGAPSERNGLSGDVFTFEGLQIDPERQVFQDSIVFLVNGVHVDGGPDVEGEGVLDLRFTVAEQNGDIVHTTTVTDPLYCAFGGDTNTCAVWNFAENGYRWPNGALVRSGPHEAIIEGRGVDPNNTTVWSYPFNIALPDFAQGQPNTARITGITLDSTYYVVAFETVGFTPTWGAQHVHFFFDTVSAENAGQPGSGPWQLYPASADGSNSSPFTLYSTADRPAGAEKMCILVANADHSVNQGTGNCVWLP
ncbi:MAG: hypothetical protein M9928_15105 [Anaerolineae bacterium]|nr:hypothetical protein [Anaerolineae bacterium]